MAITITKAIELLTRPPNDDTTDTIFDLHDAQKLGAEALKRLKKCRQAGYKFYCQLMPGETEPE